MRASVLLTAATVITSSRLLDPWIDWSGPVLDGSQLPAGDGRPQLPAAKRTGARDATTSLILRCSGWLRSQISWCSLPFCGGTA